VPNDVRRLKILLMASDKLLRQLQATTSQNVFVMMRYSRTPQLLAVERAIRIALQRFGLIARLAKDANLSDDLWENIRIYMEASQYGVAVFEEIDVRDFNPNVSLELGFMYARQRRCLLLKDKRMPRLPTDTCGKIYRDFDTYDINGTVGDQVGAWCERDLGLTAVSDSAAISPSSEHALYDSQTDALFSSWGRFDQSLNFDQHIRYLTQAANNAPGTSTLLELQTDGAEAIGVNKKLPILRGTFEIEYLAVRSAAPALNMYFCAIPMRSPIDKLVEVGATRVSEPENASSPYRVRLFVPHQHIGDERWHWATLKFDFTSTPGCGYTICAIRLNEGCPRPGAATLRVRAVRVMTADDDATIASRLSSPG